MNIEISGSSASWSSFGDAVQNWKVEVGGKFNADEFSAAEQMEALRKAIEVNEKLLARDLSIHTPLEIKVGNWKDVPLAKQNEAIGELLKGYQSWQELGIDPFQNEPLRLGNEQLDTEVSLAERIEALSTQLKINQALEEMGVDLEKMVKVDVTQPWNWDNKEGVDVSQLKLGTLQNQLAFLELMEKLEVDLEKKIDADYSKKKLKTVLNELLPNAQLKFEGIDESVKLSKFEAEDASLATVLEMLNQGAGVYFHYGKDGIMITDKPRLP